MSRPTLSAFFSDLAAPCKFFLAAHAFYNFNSLVSSVGKNDFRGVTCLPLDLGSRNATRVCERDDYDDDDDDVIAYFSVC